MSCHLKFENPQVFAFFEFGSQKVSKAAAATPLHATLGVAVAAVAVVSVAAVGAAAPAAVGDVAAATAG